MPPVMGAAAFLMAEVLQVPYDEVMIAAIIPAFLYYLALFFQVDVEAAQARHRRRGRPIACRAWRGAARRGWYVPVPFVVLVYALVWLNLAGRSTRRCSRAAC